MSPYCSKEMETQGDEPTRPRTHSQEVAELGSEPHLLDSRAWLLTSASGAFLEEARLGGGGWRKTLAPHIPEKKYFL